MFVGRSGTPSYIGCGRKLALGGLFAALLCALEAAVPAARPDEPATPERPLPAVTRTARQQRMIAGWTVYVSTELLDNERAATERALKLLDAQLKQITRVVPPPAVAQLQKVPLWISPEYPGARPKAEYHPDPGWLRRHGRDPAMAKAVEFTNIRIFEQETRRMPNFALHELAHAYHDRVLVGGFANAEIKAAYQQAKAAGIYAKVERWHGDGRPNTLERAYAMANPMEYFAECTEAFFARNDFYPFTCQELKKHDPAMFALLAKLWGVSRSAAASTDKSTDGKQ